MKKLSVFLCLLLFSVALSSCAVLNKESGAKVDAPNPIATIEMENGSVMKVELYPNVALNTVSNFVVLAQEGFYDGLIFHRVIPGFVIQGGDPTGTGMGGPGYSIKGEFSSNGVKNDLEHTRGVISMARSAGKDSAGSQFFIVQDSQPSLDGEYATFGKIAEDDLESLKTLDAIAGIRTDDSDRPLVEQKIKKITVETFGYQYSVVKIEE